MRQALADFDISLTRIRDLANNILAQTGSALGNPSVLRLHETQQCGAVVLLTGYFEAFLKDVVRAYIDALSNKRVPFSRLPQVLQDTHFEEGGKVLAEASQALRKNRTPFFGSVPREDIAARLYSPVQPKRRSNYSILWEAFANTRSNPNPDVVKEIGRTLNVKKFWSQIAVHSGSGKSETTLSSSLHNLVVIRNACAHTGTVSPIPKPSELLDYADNLHDIGLGFVVVLESELGNYVATPPPKSVSKKKSTSTKTPAKPRSGTRSSSSSKTRTRKAAKSQSSTPKNSGKKSGK